MRIGDYFRTIIGLLMTIDNPYYFLYRIFHYLNRFVPRKVALYIYNKNIKEYKREGDYEFLIETYDGSGQAVHPDIVYYDNQYWLAITPYPYGMEEYENPCIYQGGDLSDLRSPDSPIAIQNKHTQGVHLSDPCFAVYDGILYCHYRESERKGNIEEHTIWRMQYSSSNKNWGKSSLLFNSIEDKLLSPAMLYNEEGEMIVYYVSSLNGHYSLVSTKACNSNQLIEHNIIGAPEDYYLWHIGISNNQNIYGVGNNNKELLGLFLMKSRKDDEAMKLFEVKNDGIGTEWQIVKEVKIPSAIERIIKFPYKSCYIPNSNGSILFSYRDKKSRNRLCIINDRQ